MPGLQSWINPNVLVIVFWKKEQVALHWNKCSRLEMLRLAKILLIPQSCLPCMSHKYDRHYWSSGSFTFPMQMLRLCISSYCPQSWAFSLWHQERFKSFLSDDTHLATFCAIANSRHEMLFYRLKQIHDHCLILLPFTEHLPHLR